MFVAERSLPLLAKCCNELLASMVVNYDVVLA
jgi:hypothetical protein